jgi:hypothetical protein
MAKLPDQTLTTIFDLQQRLVELIDKAKATEFSLFEQFGEKRQLYPNLSKCKAVSRD